MKLLKRKIITVGCSSAITIPREYLEIQKKDGKNLYVLVLNDADIDRLNKELESIELDLN